METEQYYEKDLLKGAFLFSILKESESLKAYSDP